MSRNDELSVCCVGENNCLTVEEGWGMAGPDGPCVRKASRGRLNMETACKGRDMTFWTVAEPRTIRSGFCVAPVMWGGPSPGKPSVESKTFCLRLGCDAPLGPVPWSARGSALGRILGATRRCILCGSPFSFVCSLALFSFALTAGGDSRTPCIFSAPRGFVGAVAV